MTPAAERARLVDEQERRAESAAILQRALTTYQTKCDEDRARWREAFGCPAPIISPAKPPKPRGRKPQLVEAFGLKLSLADWSERSDQTEDLLRNRLKLGWPLEIALVAPPRMRLERALNEYAGKTPAFLH